jgi:RNA polymerase sigma-70 factor (ECF subfamily)
MCEGKFAEGAVGERADLATYFGRRGVPPSDQEDLAQESLLLAWRLRERIDPGKERSFLYGVASRLLRAYWRKQGQRLMTPLYRDVSEATDESRHENGAAASQCSQIVAKEEADHLYRLLAELPERQREVVRSIYFEGRTLAATAVRLRIGKDTVATHRKRALQRLKQLLAAEGCE